MATSRRELIKASAALGGALWTAPRILATQAAGASTCTYYAYKVDNTMSCTAITSNTTTGGNNCTGMNTAWSAKVPAAGSGVTYGSVCPTSTGTYSRVTVVYDTSNGKPRVTVTFPPGSITPYFLGVRYNNGCAWLNCSGFGSNCTSVSKDIADTFTGTPLSWNRTTRRFTAQVDGWTSGVNGISHVVFAWQDCGSSDSSYSSDSSSSSYSSS